MKINKVLSLVAEFKLFSGREAVDEFRDASIINRTEFSCGKLHENNCIYFW